MKVIDFRITNHKDGTLSDEMRRQAMFEAQQMLNGGADFSRAEKAACSVAFADWARWPESAELVVDDEAE